MILKTEFGERVGVLNFGSTLGRFFFEPSNADTHVLPPALKSRMGVSPKDMLDGKGKATLSLTLDWICGFSIPIIMIRTFIVLNTFLLLISLIFQWMPFVKIRIPFPKKT